MTGGSGAGVARWDESASVLGPGVAAGSIDALATEAALRVVLETALAAVVTMDEEGLVTGWSGRAERTFGWTRGQALGCPLAELIIPVEYRERHVRGLEHYRATGEGPALGSVLELSALHRDGHEFPVEIRISPAARVDGRTTFIAFLADITERRRAAEDLAAMYEAARAAEERMAGFLNTVVHELRTPLTVIAGYSDLLQQGMGDNPEHRERLLRVIVEQTEAMQELVDGVLLTARAQVVTATLPPTVLDLRDALGLAVDRAAPAALLAGATVTWEPPDEPVTVRADPPQLRRILDNLIANALKYGGSPARVTVHLAAAGDAASVSVSDSGPGVPPEMAERIFERFVRGSETTEITGTGLGLFLARQIAERHGGTLVLDPSRAGPGATFVLTLPITRPGG